MATTITMLTNDPVGVRALASALASKGFLCRVLPLRLSPSGLPEGAIDLVVVDLDGPRVMPAHETFLRRIKEELRLPVIALVEESAVAGWEPEAKVEDFAVKPVHVEELAARIRRVLARREKAVSGSQLQCGNLVIDADACQVFVGGKAVDLTFKEYELLKFLATNPGKAHTREALLSQVWGYDYYGGERTVDVHIRRIRGKIEVGEQTFIETVRGVGYRFKGVREP